MDNENNQAESSNLAHISAAQAFSALGSEARLEIVRLLVRAAPKGLPVGRLQEKLNIPPSTLSHHVKFLASCDLVSQLRTGRSLICRAKVDRIEALVEYLTQECCLDSDQIANEEDENQRQGKF